MNLVSNHSFQNMLNELSGFSPNMSKLGVISTRSNSAEPVG